MIVVTGGAGFIGQHLIRELLKTNDVLCIDNLITSSFENIQQLKQVASFYKHKLVFIYDDVCNIKNIPYDFNQLYHLACPASPVAYKKHPLDVLKTCTLGMFNIIELCKNHNAKLLYTSTSEIYGDALQTPQSETYWGNVNPIGERSCYDEGKRCGESILINSDIDFSIARLFNTFGSYMNPGDGRVIAEFIRSALLQEQLKIHGSGKQTRSFCHIDDTVSALLLLMNSNVKNPINIGNPNNYITIVDLAKMILELTKSCSSIVHLNKDADDPFDRKPDISLAYDLLKWIPKISLEKGLNQVIEHYKTLKF